MVGTDETSAPLTEQATRAPGCHNPHVYTVRTKHAYTRVGDGPSRDLVWYGAAGDRTKASISAFGILDPYRGVLIRDDYCGYLSYDDDLAELVDLADVAEQPLPVIAAEQEGEPVQVTA